MPRAPHRHRLRRPPRPREDAIRALLYAGTTFLSAFLLFQVQPLIGKYILPWFGGGSTVWTTTMLFFQVALLGGYAYAHFVSDRLSPRRQGLVHLVLLVLAIAALPIIPRDALRPGDEGDPTWSILVLLAITVGAPYLLLSSTAPLIQRWFSHDHPGTSPYRLYALSNVGSLLALVTYPILFERFLGLRAQAWLWSGGYVAFVLLCGALALGFLRSSRGDEPREAPTAIEDGATGEPARRVAPMRCRILAAALRVRLGAAARHDEPAHAGRRGHPVPVGRAAGPLPAHVHPLLRRRPRVPPRSTMSCSSR